MTATLAIIGMMTAVLGSDQSGNKRQAKFVPLIQVSGTTAPSGELKVSPSVLLYLNPRVDLQLSPIFKATTKDGSATLNLAQPSDSSGWAAGGGFVAHILHEHGSVSDCSRTPHSKVCKVLAEAVQECDRLLEVEPISSCSKTACPEKPEDKAYCAARPSLSESPRQEIGRAHV